VPEATDAKNNMSGTNRMLETLNQYADASPKQILAEVHESVHRFVKDAEQFDDMTMLCLKYNGTANQPAETPKTENGQKG
jgi:serine phosphatase RsbU (regulator of sigma subunit)